MLANFLEQAHYANNAFLEISLDEDNIAEYFKLNEVKWNYHSKYSLPKWLFPTKKNIFTKKKNELDK